MRIRFPQVLEDARVLEGLYATRPLETFGAFMLRSLTIIVADGSNWDLAKLPLPVWEHVSVSARGRCPTWAEMEFVRELVFLPEETVMQLSVPRADHVNVHPYTLHLWRPIGVEIPRPPKVCV